MAPNNRDDNDDEMDLINAEFEAMVSDLNLDQSVPTTYLDDLDAIDSATATEIYNPPRIRRGLHGNIKHIGQALSRWWQRNNGDDSDGAIL